MQHDATCNPSNPAITKICGCANTHLNLDTRTTALRREGPRHTRALGAASSIYRQAVQAVPNTHTVPYIGMSVNAAGVLGKQD